MSFGIFIKYIRSLFVKSSICRRLALMDSGQCLVLAYHRVLPKIEVGPQIESGMYVTPEALKAQIQFLKRFFEIVGVDQLEHVLSGGTVVQKPHCVLSFDDGWLDFYKNAWPVLLEEQVPAVVYLPTDLIGTESNFWTDRLARLLDDSRGRHAVAAQLAKAVDLKIETVLPLSLRKFDSIITLLKQYPHQIIEKLLIACEVEGGTFGEVGNRSFMNWGEVRELHASGMISFGSHTVHHAILTTLSAEEIAAELQEAKEKLQFEKVGEQQISFCYPNGNYSAEIVKMVKESGYSSGMTCDSGWNGKGADLFTLKRVSVHQDVSFTEALFAYRLQQFC